MKYPENAAVPTALAMDSATLVSLAKYALRKITDVQTSNILYVTRSTSVKKLDYYLLYLDICGNSCVTQTWQSKC